MIKKLKPGDLVFLIGNDFHGKKHEKSLCRIRKMYGGYCNAEIICRKYIYSVPGRYATHLFISGWQLYKPNSINVDYANLRYLSGERLAKRSF